MTTFTLSRLEYDILWDHLGLGPLPTVMRIDGHGRTGAERDALRIEAWTSLRDRGYGTLTALDDALEWCLRTLAAPEWEVDARLHLSADGARTSALAASQGRHAVVSALDSGSLALRTAATDDLAQAAVGLLPEHPPGPSRSVTIAAEDLDAAAGRAGQDAGALAAELRRRGLGVDRAGDVAGVLGDVRRFGQFGVSRTPRGGTRVRADHVVSFYDNSAARYSFTRRRSGGHEWVTLVGANGHLLARQVEELREQLC
jgi:hypothetical protein